MADHVRLLVLGDPKVVLGEPVSETPAPGVDLHEERSRLLTPLQLDEVIATAQ